MVDFLLCSSWGYACKMWKQTWSSLKQLSRADWREDSQHPSLKGTVSLVKMLTPMTSGRDKSHSQDLKCPQWLSLSTTSNHWKRKLWWIFVPWDHVCKRTLQRQHAVGMWLTALSLLVMVLLKSLGKYTANCSQHLYLTCVEIKRYCLDLCF